MCMDEISLFFSFNLIIVGLVKYLGGIIVYIEDKIGWILLYYYLIYHAALEKNIIILFNLI